MAATVASPRSVLQQKPFLRWNVSEGFKFIKIKTQIGILSPPPPPLLSLSSWTSESGLDFKGVVTCWRCCFTLFKILLG